MKKVFLYVLMAVLVLSLAAFALVLLLNGTKDKIQLEQHNLCINYLEQTIHGKQIKPGFSPGQIRTPAIILPGDTLGANKDLPSIEFFKMTPEQDFPTSRTNHWKLPYAACGLLEGKCPASSSDLQSDMNADNTCIFYSLDKSLNTVNLTLNFLRF